MSKSYDKRKWSRPSGMALLVRLFLGNSDPTPMLLAEVGSCPLEHDAKPSSLVNT